MITIVSALKSEFASLLEHFPVSEKVRLGAGSLYISGKFHFLRSAVGQQNSEEVFKLYFARFNPKKVLNIGFAGRLDPSLELNSIFHISEVKSPWRKSIVLEGESPSSTKLLTVNKAVTDSRLRDRFFREFAAGLVDMEAYSQADICHRKSIPFQCVKIVSDQADEKTIQTFKEQLNQLSKILADYVSSLLRLPF